MKKAIISYPFPGFYNSAKQGNPDYQSNEKDIVGEVAPYRGANQITNARADQKIVSMINIDVQYDFCHPNGGLFVPGAVEDTSRTVEFIYRNINNITSITSTMDTHRPFQIFFAEFWVDGQGNHPGPFTVITAEDIRNNKWAPNPVVGNQAALKRQMIFYCEELAKKGKYSLMIWPAHCLLGSRGHNLMAAYFEAVRFHGLVRGATANEIELKGANLLTEHYSIAQPEVLTTFDGKPLGSKNVKLFDSLLKSHMVIVAGQAASHCVAWFVHDLLNEINSRKALDQNMEDLVKKVYILKDCTSPVGGFEKNAADAMKEFEDAGMHVVESIVPMDQWPDADMIFGN